ncbi:hypothetical protein [Nocardia noduli]|uniref:hypothetical protein n=1 Tax=Nocardia noduli TaxID=2815722 RepID=UPI001C24C550|nr:hypothetical protein [Nocardia noduli]
MIGSRDGGVKDAFVGCPAQVCRAATVIAVLDEVHRKQSARGRPDGLQVLANLRDVIENRILEVDDRDSDRALGSCVLMGAAEPIPCIGSPGESVGVAVRQRRSIAFS